MSMLGVSFLNEIVRKKEVTNTADVLNHLRTSVIDALKQTGEEGTQKDGMDMSLIAIHKDKKQALWAGANNPLWIVRSPKNQTSFENLSGLGDEKKIAAQDCNDGVIVEVKGDKQPVSIHIKMETFTNHEITLKKGDRIYLFTDGLPDQFGGPKGKKFKYKQFKTILAETANLTMKEQGEQIEKQLDNWMNFEGKKHDQIDDITVVGIKI